MSKYNHNVFKFIINFDINYISLKKDFNLISSVLKNEFVWLNDFKFSFLNSASKNLNNLFINSKKFETNQIQYYTKKCNITDCITCKFLYNDNFLLTNTFTLPITSNSNCLSTNVIYVILCKKCKLYYIGQTSRNFCDRSKEHI